MKCKRCSTTTNVVKYGRGLKYKGVPVPTGAHCHDCIRAFKKTVDGFLSSATDPEDIEARASAHHDAEVEHGS